MQVLQRLAYLPRPFSDVRLIELSPSFNPLLRAYALDIVLNDLYILVVLIYVVQPRQPLVIKVFQYIHLGGQFGRIVLSDHLHRPQHAQPPVPDEVYLTHSPFAKQ